MAVSVYVDGSGGPNSGFGYYIAETGESFYERQSGLTNNQAEYMAIISALKMLTDAGHVGATIYSDSKNTVSQLNHEYAINNEHLRTLARQAWPLVAGLEELKITWVPRSENLAGKMLGS